MLNLFKRSAKVVLNSQITKQLLPKKQIGLYRLPLKNLNTQNKSQYPSDNILAHKIDAYKSATIDPTSLPDDPIKFEQMLKESMDYFRESKVRGVWLNLEISKSALIPTALKHEFTLHHAKTGYVLLTHWIPKNEPNMLPHFATHFIGIGGAVVREDTNEILVIQEKISLIGDYWKIPGGLVDEGELLSKAAQREVWEETGIKAEFQSILAFREKLVYRWGQPDIYFVALLKPLTFDIKMCPTEIGAARWMKIEEYLEKDMIMSQKKIAQTVAFHSLGKDGIKNLDNSRISDLYTFSGEKFMQDIIAGPQTDHIFYCANAVREWNKSRAKSN